MRDAWRLAMGTLTAWPVRPPLRVDAAVAGRAMLLAPLALVPVVVVLGGAALGLGGAGATPPLVAALLLAGLVVSTRGLHLDGLADTADGLSTVGGRERALRVMKRGDVGPSGVAAIVVVLLVQVTALAALAATPTGLVLAGIAVLASRHTLAWACRRGRPAASADGLGAAVAGTVGAVPAAVALAVLLAGAAAAADPTWWAGLVVVLTALTAPAVLLARARARLGGITGDVLGAGIELSLAAALVAAALVAP